MRNRWIYLKPPADYLAVLAGVFGLLLLVPLAVRLIYLHSAWKEVGAHTYWVPAAGALVLAVLLKRDLRFPPLDTRRAMILCALGWLVVSAIGAIPFCLGIGVGYLDAFFETVSGFTTTGITMLTGLDEMPRSLLFWRSFTQWLGGLGILTFFLAVIYTGGSAHRLFSAESHKVFSRRPAPGIFHTLRILWGIYALFTGVIILTLLPTGMSLYDAVLHAMTALSTGGYSPYDASIAHYRQAGYAHYALIEYILIVGMLMGGINFFIHWRLLHGGIRSLWDNLEMRLWWLIVVVATALVMLNCRQNAAAAGESVEELFRGSLFQTVSILTTTGFGTKDIATGYFPALAKQVFLILMVIGGCVGSTGGGIKVLRVGVLFKMIGRQVKRLLHGPDVVHPVVVDGEPVPPEELRRISALFFAWMGLLVFGALVTSLLSHHDALAGASGMFSALGNIGPCYIPLTTAAGTALEPMNGLHALIKIVYILGMLAGRLEILPLLLLFTPRAWR